MVSFALVCGFIIAPVEEGKNRNHNFFESFYFPDTFNIMKADGRWGKSIQKKIL